jgi:protein O-mannosyl-transferase
MNKKSSLISFSPAWLLIVPVLLITYWVFMPSNSFAFLLWDDDKYIVENTELLNSDLKTITTATVAGNYHPLTLLSLRWNLAKGTPKPNAFHEWNNYLHLANTLLVFLLFLAYRSPVWVGVGGALFFGVHPLHVESVAWISERKDVLYTFFLLLSWISWKNVFKLNANLSYSLSFLFFILSCFSKGMAIVLPFILLLDTWLLQAPEDRKKITFRLIPFVLTSGVFAWLAIWAQETVGAIRQSTDFSSFDKLFFPFYGILFYLTKMVAPINLSAVYPYPFKENGLLPWTYLISLPIIAIMAGMLFWLRKNKLLVFGFAGYLIALLPVLQILPVGNAITADRYFYVSSIPLCIGLFLTLSQKLSFKKEFWFGLFVLPGLLLIIPARARVLVWKDTFSLFQDVVQKFPQVAVAHYNMGNILMNDKKDYPAAISSYQKAIEARPAYADAWTNLGVCLQYLQSYRDGVNCLLRAVSYNPEHVEAHNNLGVGYEKLDKTDSALYHYRIAMRLNPAKVELYNNVGFALEKMNQLDSAQIYYTRALELKPDYAVAMVNLGNTLLRRGFTQQDADVWFVKAAQNGHPEAQEYLKNRGVRW